MTQNGSSPGFCHAGYQPGINSPQSYVLSVSICGMNQLGGWAPPVPMSTGHQPSASNWAECGATGPMAARWRGAVRPAPFGTSKRGLNGSVRSSKSCCRFSHFEFPKQQCLWVSISESRGGRSFAWRAQSRNRTGTEPWNPETLLSRVAKLDSWVVTWPMGPGTKLGKPFGKRLNSLVGHRSSLHGGLCLPSPILSSPVCDVFRRGWRKGRFQVACNGKSDGLGRGVHFFMDMLWLTRVSENIIGNNEECLREAKFQVPKRRNSRNCWLWVSRWSDNWPAPVDDDDDDWFMSIEVYWFEVLKSVCFMSWMVKFPISQSCAEFPKGRIANTRVRFKECSWCKLLR